MANVCAICGKGPTRQGKRKLLRGHYNPVKRRWKYPNLQWVRLPSGLLLAEAGSGHAKAGKRVFACAKCIKRLSLAKKS